MNRLQQAPPSLMASLYLCAAFLVIVPIVVELQRVWPLQPASLDWRFGTEGFFLTALTTPILGLALATLLAFGRGYPGPQRLVGTVALAIALLAAAVLVAFLIDFQATLPRIPFKSVPVVKATAGRTVISAGLAVLTGGALGVAGWRASSIRG